MKFASTVALALLLAAPATAWADDAAKPPDPVKETWTTSEGTLTIGVLPFSFEGTYDQDNGRMIGAQTDGTTYAGYWGEDSSNTECPTSMLGTKYWGRITFTFDAARKHFDGKWGYCGDAPDRDWTGDIAK